MEEMKKIENLVTLTGIIVNMYETPTCMAATIAISLPIRQKDGSFNIVSNYPKVYFFKQDQTGIDDIKIGMNVAVSGHVVAPKKTRRGTDKTYYSQSIVGDSIRENKSAIAEAGIYNGHRSLDAENNVYIEGVVERVERVTEKVAYFTVAAYNKSFYNKVKVACYDSKYLVIAPGNTVSINGYVSTTMKVVEGGKKIKHQNIVAYSVQDLGKLPANEEKEDYRAEKEGAIKESYETRPLCEV